MSKGRDIARAARERLIVAFDEVTDGSPHETTRRTVLVTVEWAIDELMGASVYMTEKRASIIEKMADSAIAASNAIASLSAECATTTEALHESQRYAGDLENENSELKKGPIPGLGSGDDSHKFSPSGDSPSEAFGKKFLKSLSSYEMRELSRGIGGFDTGGCWIFAQGISDYYGDGVQLIQVSDDVGVFHVAAAIGNMVYDGQGAETFEGFVDRFPADEGYTISPLVAREARRINYDQGYVDSVSRRLRDSLGDPSQYKGAKS